MIDFTDEDVQLAVKRGVSWLDESHPDWVNLIDLSKLNMDNCSNCVIGQAVGSYYRTIAQEALNQGGQSEEEWAVAHGFQAPGEYDEVRDPPYYRKLEELWTNVVLERENQ